MNDTPEMITAVGNLFEALSPLLIAALGVLGGWLGHGRKRTSKKQAEDRKLLEVIAEDAATAKEGVTNNHKSNLRDDLDAIHSDVRRVAELVDSHTGTLERIDRRMTTLDERQVVLERESDRERARLWKALADRPTSEAPARPPRKNPQRRRH